MTEDSWSGASARGASAFRDIRWKLRYVFLPLALFLLLLPPLYALSVWLVEQFGLELDSEMAGFWLPALLAFGAVQFFAQEHVGKLKFPTRRDLTSLYFLVAVAALAIPIGLAHWVEESESEQVVHIATAATIRGDDSARYYVIAKPCMTRPSVRAFPTVRRNARNGTPEDFEIYVAVPACDQPDPPTVWIGFMYSGPIKDRSQLAMDREYQSFAAGTNRTFATENITSYGHYERLGSSRERRNFLHAIQGSSGSSGALVVLAPHKGPYVRPTRVAFETYLWSLGIGLVIWLAMALLPSLDHRKLRRHDKRDELFRSFLSQFYRPRRERFGAAILIDTNVAVFAFMAFSGLGVASFDAVDLIGWGASYGPIDHGWGLLRLVSSLFIHGGLMHLANNMGGLVFACIFLAQPGKAIAENGRLIFTYLFCGVVGNAASIAMHPKNVTVGASGAILGLWGVLMVLALLRDARLEGSERTILVGVALFAGLTILLGVFLPGVDNVAHVAGFAAGCALGFAYAFIDRDTGGTRSMRNSDASAPED